MAKHIFYVVDRANQFHVRSFENLDAYYAEFDQWEAGGHDVYTDRDTAIRNIHGSYNRMKARLGW